MRICFGIATHSSLLEPRMGSERAIMGAAKALAKRGHKVDIVPLLHDAPKEGYDIYHWWNAGGPKGPLLAFARFAHEHGKPCVCTPIYWPPTPGFYRLLVEYVPQLRTRRRSCQGLGPFCRKRASSWRMGA